MRSHTGGFMTMVKGGTYVNSRKQELNIKSSTKVEFVRSDDLLTQVIWN